jgi:hypothetical protein
MPPAATERDSIGTETHTATAAHIAAAINNLFLFVVIIFPALSSFCTEKRFRSLASSTQCCRPSGKDTGKIKNTDQDLIGVLQDRMKSSIRGKREAV